MVGLLGRVISSSQGQQDSTVKTDEDKHPRRKRDSNPQSSVRAIKTRAATESALNFVFFQYFYGCWLKPKIKTLEFE
jgi:hypothetical protein